MKTLYIISLYITAVFCHYYNPLDDLSQLLPNAQIIPTRGYPWPSPQQHTTSSSYFILQPDNFKFLLNVKCDILVKAVKRYKMITFINDCSKFLKPHKYAFPKIHAGNNKQLFNLTIKVSGQCEQQPYMNMDEQYLLKINAPDKPGEALLFSTSVWGALRGLETFSQIVYPLPEGVFAVNTTTILDFPRFSHRGLLIDTSRHFVSKSILLQNLDAMAQTKLNVFHWHIVDDQSFPYVSKIFPDLSNKGAFNKETHTYSFYDVADIIEYARERGIRTVVEFDTPGHTLSWGKGQLGLLTACYKSNKPDGTYGPIDPTNERNFGFLKTFFKEVARVFPENYIHLGGDEVSFACWKSNPDISDFMQKHGFDQNYAKLEEYYMQKLLDIVKSVNKSYIVWQEVFDNQVKLKPDTVVHVWKDPYRSELENVTAAGFKALLSTCWYLNYINYGSDWTSYYNCEPYNFTGTAEQKKLIMGGEACMWGEYVDGSNLITRTWPRAAAVAERLWSSQDLTDAIAAAPRLEELRCRMIKRGLKVEPVNGPGFCECDYLM